MGKTPSPRWQAIELMKSIDARGTSKYEAKQNYYRECKVNGEKATISGMHEKLGIYSHRTADEYRDAWVQLLEHARSTEGIKRMENLTTETIQSFITAKIADGVTAKTIAGYIAAISKLGLALDMQHNTSHYQADFKAAASDIINTANLRSNNEHTNRAYADARGLVGAINREDFRIAAELMLTTGIRCAKACLVRQEQVNGNKLTIIAKGGQKLERTLSNDLRAKVTDYLAHHGELHVNQSSMRRAVQRAAEQTGQIPQGTHGLRYNYAQNLYVQLITEGKTPAEARQQVAEELGHHRSDITNLYLL